jgi:hypothetical protein
MDAERGDVPQLPHFAGVAPRVETLPDSPRTDQN